MEKTQEEIISEYFSNLGKKGGESLKKAKPTNYYKELGKKGAKKRWGSNNADIKR